MIVTSTVYIHLLEFLYVKIQSTEWRAYSANTRIRFPQSIQNEMPDLKCKTDRVKNERLNENHTNCFFYWKISGQNSEKQQIK